MVIVLAFTALAVLVATGLVAFGYGGELAGVRELSAVLSPNPVRIGGHRILAQLGGGGTGKVYVAEDASGRRLAIKVVNAAHASDPAFRERFLRDATIARRVRTFGAAAVEEAGVDGDRLYVVSEYVPGPTLENAVRATGPLTDHRLESMAMGVAGALGAIHSAGLVHGNLKPSNVILSPQGPRVTDFGFAAGSPPDDVLAWGVLVRYTAGGSVETLESRLRELVERAGTDGPTARPTVAEILNRLSSPAPVEP